MNTSSALSWACIGLRQLRLRIILGGTIDPRVALRFERRLAAYLAGSGLHHGFVGRSIDVWHAGAGIQPLERSLVIAWLAVQPEVALLRIERPSMTKEPRHGQG